MTATRSLAWSIWQRNSLALKIIAAIFLVASLFFRFFPTGEAFIPVALSLMVFFSYLGLMGIFMYQDSDVGVKGSTYPSHMFALPVKTSQLVFTPLGLGTATFLGTGLIISAALTRTDHSFPLFFPAVFMTAIYVMLTAIFWYPFGVPYSKLFLTLLGIPLLSYLAGNALENKNSEQTVCAWLVVFIAACFVAAYRGVVKARRGELYLFWWQTIEPKQVAAKPFRWMTFSDRFSAQRWYEWRQQGIILPSLVLFLCTLFMIPNYWNDTNSGSNLFGTDSQGMAPMFPTYLSTYITLLLWLVPVTAWVVGCGARRNEVKNTDRSFYLFFGTRPMSDGALVAQKLWSSLKSSLIAWVIVLCCMALLLPFHGSTYNPQEGIMRPNSTTIYAMLVHFGNLRAVEYFLAGLLILMAITWRNYAVGFWTEMSGFKWLRFGYPAALLITVFGVPMAIGNLQKDTESIFYSVVVTLVWIAISIRAILVAHLVRKQLLSGVMPLDSFRRGLIGYGSAVAIFIYLALWMTQGVRSSFVNYLHFSSLWTIWAVCGFVLFWTPVVRILLATEMLHQNRHRAN